MKYEKTLSFISCGIVLPFVSLYLIFAFIMWDIWWPAHCDVFTRILFVPLLILTLIGFASTVQEEIYGKENHP